MTLVLAMVVSEGVKMDEWENENRGQFSHSVRLHSVKNGGQESQLPVINHDQKGGLSRIGGTPSLVFLNPDAPIVLTPPVKSWRV